MVCRNCGFYMDEDRDRGTLNLMNICLLVDKRGFIPFVGKHKCVYINDNYIVINSFRGLKEGEIRFPPSHKNNTGRLIT